MMASRVQVIFVALLTAGCAGQRQAPTVRQPSSFDFREPPAWFVSAPQAGAARLVDPGREANIHVVVSVVEPGALTGTEGKLADLLASCGPIAGKSAAARRPQRVQMEKHCFAGRARPELTRHMMQISPDTSSLIRSSRIS
jgi:hypothetical protein